jgi:hypothetical protein
MGWNNIDLVGGHMLSLTNNADKSRTSAAIYMHDNKLYILEGTVPAGYPEPAFFQQSVGWIDESATRFVMRRYTTSHFSHLLSPTAAGGGKVLAATQADLAARATPRLPITVVAGANGTARPLLWRVVFGSIV